MIRTWDRKHLRDRAAIERARADGYQPYATSVNADGEAVTHLERPSPSALDAADAERDEAQAQAEALADAAPTPHTIAPTGGSWFAVVGPDGETVEKVRGEAAARDRAAELS